MIAWAMHKLATCRDFTAEHWGWIATLDQYGRTDGYSQLMEIVRPAIAASPAWRRTEAEREQELEKLDKAADYLLRVLESSMRLNVSLSGVVGQFPEMQPLLDHSRSLWMKEMKRGDEAARKARKAGADVGSIIRASLPLDGYREPRLSDYLWSLRAAIRGKLSEARPTGQRGTVEDFFDGLEQEEAAKLSERFGFVSQKINPIDHLRPGGDFGAYPARQDALRRAVILAFPGTIFSRVTEKPKATPASMIEAACLAWFGAAPTPKEINAAIKPVREKLEPAMRRNINAYKKQVERTAKWKAAGLSDDEIRRRSMMSFLEPDDDDDELSDLEKKMLTGLREVRRSKGSKAAKGQKAGNPPRKK